MITTKDLKRPPVTEAIRLRHLTSAQVPKRTGGPFNFDKGQFVYIKRRPTNRVKGAMFSADLRTIQEAKERKEKEAAIAQAKAVQAQKLAEAKAVKAAKVVIQKRTLKGTIKLSPAMNATVDAEIKKAARQNKGKAKAKK